jgi:hypothetical protein
MYCVASRMRRVLARGYSDEEGDVEGVLDVVYFGCCSDRDLYVCCSWE